MKNKPMTAVIMVMALLFGSLALDAIAAGPSDSRTALRQGIMAGQQQARTVLKAVTELTGLSQEEVCAQRQEGKSLSAIAENEGVDPQTVLDKITAERTARLEQLRIENRISAEQYENCRENMEERVKTNLERTSAGPASDNNNGPRMGCAWKDRSNKNQGQGQGQGQGRGMGGHQGNCPYNQ